MILFLRLTVTHGFGMLTGTKIDKKQLTRLLITKTVLSTSSLIQTTWRGRGSPLIHLKETRPTFATSGGCTTPLQSGSTDCKQSRTLSIPRTFFNHLWRFLRPGASVFELYAIYPSSVRLILFWALEETRNSAFFQNRTKWWENFWLSGSVALS